VSSLSDFVRVKPRFHRSVSVLHDALNSQAKSSYVLTPIAEEIALRIARSLNEPTGDRAWSLTGPYGCGKSSFALFLSDMLGPGAPLHAKAGELRSAAGLADPNLLPVFIVGDRSRLLPAIADGLADAVRPYAPEFAAGLSSRAQEINPTSVWTMVEDSLEVLRAHSIQGFLMVIDELGKFLEYEALHPELGDIFTLQVLAEGAARRPGEFALVTILHSAFSDYLGDASEVRVAEWQKIQGRFCDIPFFLPGEQVLTLISEALTAQWPDDLDALYNDTLGATLSTEVFEEVKGKTVLEPLLKACLPFHPVTALLLWPLFRSKLAQNERSLFSFLTSTERHSFREFLEQSPWPSDQLPLYRPDRLYDYVTNALGTAAFLGDQARRWGEIAHVLEKLDPDSPPLASSVVKTIGLLSLYGREAGLRATRETLEVALGDAPGVGDALSYLEAGSHIVFRRHEGAYALWEGSDVNLDECYAEALRHISSGSIAERLSKVIAMPALVARGHYVRTGTLRYFTREVIDGSVEALAVVAEGKPPEGAVGRIIYVLSNPDDRHALMAQAQDLTSKLPPDAGVILFAFPKPMIGLDQCVTELEAWVWASENVPALQGDPVARREVRARLAAAKSRLGRVAGNILGLPGFRFSPEASEWVYSGERLSPRSHRAFVHWLSEVLDAVFAEAPILQNELINRDNLSSAASAARRNLVEAMLTRSREPRLGIIGYPAEATMYESILLLGGFHQATETGWRFVSPGASWKGPWSAGVAFLKGSTAEPRPITELYRLWREPPYGLKAGPLPVLLTALLMANQEEVALYEEGVFVPELRIEILERLMRNPQDFSIRCVPLDEEARSALELLGAALPTTASDPSTRSQLVAMARQLVLFAAKLPPYSRFTRRLPPQVLSVRETLLRAKDPISLLLEELPRALGCSLKDRAQKAVYAQRLREAVLTLEGAYPSLLTEIEDSIRAALGIRATGREAALELARRAAALLPYTCGGRLGRFIHELVRDAGSEWGASLGRVIADGTPPHEWRDRHVTSFQARLAVLSADFIRLEELVARKQQGGGVPIVKVEFLDGSYLRAEAATTVPMENESAVEELARRLKAVLSDDSVQSNNGIPIAALARTLAEKLNQESDAEESETA